MRAALIGLLVAAAAPARAGTPLVLSERQVVTLEFSQPVLRVQTTDPDLLHVQVGQARVRIEAARGGRCTLDLSFGDGATVSYEVVVEGARRAQAALTPTGTNDLVLAVGEERRFRSPGITRALVEENGVAKVSVQGETVSVIALGGGRSTMVLVDGAGAKSTWTIVVR